MKESIVAEKAFSFALRIIKLYKYLIKEKCEFVISKQLLRSGTSIGANIEEARYAQSRKDFISKLSISLKESAETMYWLKLLRDSKEVNDYYLKDVIKECDEIIRMLSSIVKSSKERKT
ncbi:four helix bundle protein [Caminicella sporogenes]|uniref:four helix bundle protein n=1 Tax=Caminicella sporogenes TaxID=166485 RepID=UPI002541193C|nr:four helix bundle protein [Caminicella sporogenes]WIF96131.1 four helix bundle protein [Caminicella sporogenes]